MRFASITSILRWAETNDWYGTSDEMVAIQKPTEDNWYYFVRADDKFYDLVMVSKRLVFEED